MDGTVAFLDFSQDELGDPLNEEEKVEKMHKHTSVGETTKLTIKSS